MRVLLFILMQVAVLVVVGIVGSIIMALLGIRITPGAYGGLFVMCAIFGCVGSMISLFMSKSMRRKSPSRPSLWSWISAMRMIFSW